MLFAVAVLLALPLAASPVHAAPSFGLQLAMGEYAGLSPLTHGGAYASWGLYASFPVGPAIIKDPADSNNDKLINVIPAIGVELAVDNGQWGFIPCVTIDVPVHRRLGLDLMLMLMHNQVGRDWSGAELLLGIGPGVSVYLSDSWSLSANALLFRSLTTQGWAFFPGIGVSRSIP